MAMATIGQMGGGTMKGGNNGLNGEAKKRVDLSGITKEVGNSPAMSPSPNGDYVVFYNKNGKAHIRIVDTETGKEFVIEKTASHAALRKDLLARLDGITVTIEHIKFGEGGKIFGKGGKISTKSKKSLRQHNFTTTRLIKWVSDTELLIIVFEGTHFVYYFWDIESSRQDLQPKQRWKTPVLTGKYVYNNSISSNQRIEGGRGSLFLGTSSPPTVDLIHASRNDDGNITVTGVPASECLRVGFKSVSLNNLMFNVEVNCTSNDVIDVYRHKERIIVVTKKDVRITSIHTNDSTLQESTPLFAAPVGRFIQSTTLTGTTLRPLIYDESTQTLESMYSIDVRECSDMLTETPKRRVEETTSKARDPRGFQTPRKQSLEPSPDSSETSDLAPNDSGAGSDERWTPAGGRSSEAGDSRNGKENSVQNQSGSVSRALFDGGSPSSSSGTAVSEGEETNNVSRTGMGESPAAPVSGLQAQVVSSPPETPSLTGTLLSSKSNESSPTLNMSGSSITTVEKADSDSPSSFPSSQQNLVNENGHVGNGELEDKLARLENELKAAREGIITAKATAETATQRAASKDGEIERLNAEVERLKAQLAQPVMRIAQQLDQESEREEQRAAELKGLRSELEASAARELDRVRREGEERLENLRREHSHLTNAERNLFLEQNEHLQGQLADRDAQIQDLTRSITALEEQLREKSNDLESARAEAGQERASSEEALAEKGAQIQVLTGSITALEEQLREKSNDLESARAEARQERASSEEALTELKEKHAAKVEKMASLVRIIASMGNSSQVEEPTPVVEVVEEVADEVLLDFGAGGEATFNGGGEDDNTNNLPAETNDSGNKEQENNVVEDEAPPADAAAEEMEKEREEEEEVNLDRAELVDAVAGAGAQKKKISWKITCCNSNDEILGHYKNRIAVKAQEGLSLDKVEKALKESLNNGLEEASIEIGRGDTYLLKVKPLMVPEKGLWEGKKVKVLTPLGESVFDRNDIKYPAGIAICTSDDRYLAGCKNGRHAAEIIDPNGHQCLVTDALRAAKDNDKKENFAIVKGFKVRDLANGEPMGLTELGRAKGLVDDRN